MDNPQIISHIAQHILHDYYPSGSASESQSQSQSPQSYLASFRLTSHLINSIVEPLLFETVDIALQGRQVGRKSSKLLDMLSRRKRLCLLVKRVKIQSFNPSSRITDVHGHGRRTRTLEESLEIIARFRNVEEVVWHIWSHSTLYQSYSPLLFSILGSRSSLPFLSSFTLSLLGSGSHPGSQLVFPPEAKMLRGLSVLRIQCPTPIAPTATPALTVTRTRASPASGSVSTTRRPGPYASFRKRNEDGWESGSSSSLCSLASASSSSSTLVEHEHTYSEGYPYPYSNVNNACYPSNYDVEETLFAPILAIIDHSPDLRALQVEFRPPPPRGSPPKRTMTVTAAAVAEAEIEEMQIRVEEFLEEVRRRRESLDLQSRMTRSQRWMQARGPAERMTESEKKKEKKTMRWSPWRSVGVSHSRCD